MAAQAVKGKGSVPITEDFFAILVAIAVECHQVDEENIADELSASQLIEGIKKGLQGHPISENFAIQEFIMG